MHCSKELMITVRAVQFYVVINVYLILCSDLIPVRFIKLNLDGVCSFAYRTFDIKLNAEFVHV
ncbi:hypothetical protein TALK_04200 [Thalassospira alkalitolerans]|uniref:Uncharacterized protein n=1 Tax=Thalassospira alkalitolerans TaxID=1293890 RepID=A0A1Y2LFY3_9PROT|nr:hypothetical protein TALK_04200 [Thalassospira alkalitolerans]